MLETTKLFNEIAKKLEAHGMSWGYHNHIDEFSGRRRAAV